jgi:hypothetical protein
MGALKHRPISDLTNAFRGMRRPIGYCTDGPWIQTPSRRLLYGRALDDMQFKPVSELMVVVNFAYPKCAVEALAWQ